MPELTSQFNETERPGADPVPWLGALVCNSPFDLALHDAYGVLHGVPTHETYNDRYMSLDLGHFLTPAQGTDVSFDAAAIDPWIPAGESEDGVGLVLARKHTHVAVDALAPLAAFRRRCPVAIDPRR